MKLYSILRVIIISIILFIAYVIMTKFWSHENGILFFILFSILFTAMVLPLELLNILGYRNIFQLKRFDWARLLCLIPVILNLYNAFNSPEDAIVLFGLNEQHFIAITWILLMFLYRDNFVVISERKIKLQGNGGWVNSTSIIWRNVTGFEVNENSIQLESKNYKLEIPLNDVRKNQLQTLIDQVNRNTGHNN